MEWLLIILGTILVWLPTWIVYKNLYKAQLSMTFWGATTEHQQGLSFKLGWPFSTLQEPQVDMRANMVISSGGLYLMSMEEFIAKKIHEKMEPKVYEAKGAIPIYVKWATAMRPRKGHLAKFLLKTPEVAALMTMADIDAQLSDKLATMEADDILHQKAELNTFIAGVFGGDDEEVSSTIEEAYGTILTNPKLFDVTLGKKSQDAAEKLYETKKFKESMELLESQLNDPEKRANAIYVINGLAKKNIINIEGLEDSIKGLEGGITKVIETFLTKKP